MTKKTWYWQSNWDWLVFDENDDFVCLTDDAPEEAKANFQEWLKWKEINKDKIL